MAASPHSSLWTHQEKGYEADRYKWGEGCAKRGLSRRGESMLERRSVTRATLATCKCVVETLA